jgi:hypothetical protein
MAFNPGVPLSGDPQWLQIIERQGQQLGQIEAERNDLRLRLEQLRQHVVQIEADHALRLEVIERQGVRIGQLERSSPNHAARLAELERGRARELLRLTQHGDRVDEARALVRKTLVGILTPRMVRLLTRVLDRMAAELAPTPAGRGTA